MARPTPPEEPQFGERVERPNVSAVFPTSPTDALLDGLPPDVQRVAREYAAAKNAGWVAMIRGLITFTLAAAIVVGAVAVIRFIFTG